MQPQQQQQVSFHFWNCQLTDASPKYSWDPENLSAATAAADSAAERRHKRTGRHGDGKGDGDTNGDAKGEAEKSSTGANGNEKINEIGSNGKMEASAANGADKNGDANGNSDTNDEDIGEEATDTDYMQHILKLNACILGPKATGIHLITVRTRGYQSEPDSCPLVCIDPASQRTLALGFEFVLDSQNEVTFELVEGTGPVWLTGLHQVRVHDDSGDELADASEELVEASVSDESMKEVDEDDEDDAEEEEEEEDSEEEEVIRPPAKRIARTSRSERPVPSPRQQRRRGLAKTTARAKSPSQSPPNAKSKGKGARGKAAVAKKTNNV